jgi:hypothetical protein
MACHREKLEELVHNLNLAGEGSDPIHYIIKEGIWIPSRDFHASTFPDILVIYHPTKRHRDGYGVPIELKTGHNPLADRHKAISQLRAGSQFISNVLNKQVIRGKYVFLENNEFRYEYVNRMEII